ncbi:hypothetical protein AM499_07720 [Bacillus sp. FJAT-22090]|uniref:hypothetical protein n=1 Tax=Bacillus sp. FJAT-22090 TaxID=1581038 RepID=UPI0006AFBDC5|nr:hypothetical protein [Bacillus sp. FJAT-22090]ALC85723.1 hypothetical protein AM499_07720 [Bacillus sp. FJAT-22090]
MVQLSVDEKASRKFSNFFGHIIQEQIKTYYNPDFLIHFDTKSYSFCFLENEIIISTIEGERIADINRVDYKELIPDFFLTSLLALDYAPSRVKRYKKIGVERLRLELADELRLGGITAKNANANAIWNDYQMKIKISPTFHMEIK